MKNDERALRQNWKAILILFFFLFLQTGQQDVTRIGQERKGNDIPNSSTSKLAHSQQASDSIEIVSDEDFETQGWPGAGTEEDPYVIAGLLFTYETKAIDVQNTERHFVIENCTFIHIQGAPDHSSGVYLRFVSNGVIRDCLSEGLDTAFEIFYSSGIRIENNSILPGYDGIRVFVSSRVVIDGNVFNGLNTAMLLMNSHAIEVTNNHVFENDDISGQNTGMEIHSSDELTITNCSFSDIIVGLEIRDSEEILLANSQVHNASTSVAVYRTTNASISDCTFTEIAYTSVSLDYSENCSVVNTTIIGPTISVHGSSETEWTHIIENVTVNGLPVGYFHDLESAVVNGTEYSQLFFVFCSDVEVYGDTQSTYDIEVAVMFSELIRLNGFSASSVFILWSDTVILRNITLLGPDSYFIMQDSDNVELSDLSSALGGIMRMEFCRNVTVAGGRFKETRLEIGWSSNIVISEIVVDAINAYQSDGISVSSCFISSGLDLDHVQNVAIFDSVLQESIISPHYSTFDTIRNVTVNGKPLGYFEGTGPGIILADQYGQIILVDSANIAIENGDVNGISGPIYVLQSLGIEIRDVVFHNNEGWDVTVLGSQYVKISSVLFESTGIFVEGSSYINVSQCEFRTGWISLYVEYSNYIDISGCIFGSERSYSVYTPPSAITVRASGTLRIAENEIFGGYTGIEVSNAETRFNIERIEIVGNNINNCTTGISVLNSNDGVLTSNRVMNTKGTGIDLSGSNYWNITFNEIAYTRDIGIYIDYSFGNNVYGNLFYNNTWSDAFDFGTNIWDNGESIGNCWSVFEGRTPRLVDESYESFDNYPITTSGTGFVSPVISDAPDTTVRSQDQDVFIKWVVWIDEPVQYEILKDGHIVTTGYMIQSGIAAIQMSELELGLHNYTLAVYGTSGAFGKDTVILDVVLFDTISAIPLLTLIIAAAVIAVLAGRELGVLNISRSKSEAVLQQV